MVGGGEIMRLDPMLKPVVLTTLPNEGLAHTIVGVLESEGVRAWTMGGTPMEAPNAVKVMVISADLDLAQAVLETVRAEALTIDWNVVDVNEVDDREAGTHEPAHAAAALGEAGQHSRVSLGGLGTAGAGAGLIGMQDVVFATLPAMAKPVPGCALVTAGVVWCVAKARRNKVS